MNLLDNEDILIEKVGESCNLVKPLGEILEEFSITSTINVANSKKCKEFFNKLSHLKIDGYEWTIYFDRFVLYNTETISTNFVIYFEKILQDYTSHYFNYKYKINLRIAMYYHNLSEELSSNLISLFNLNNNQTWEITSNFDYRVDYLDPDPYTSYKYIKK